MGRFSQRLEAELPRFTFAAKALQLVAGRGDEVPGDIARLFGHQRVEDVGVDGTERSQGPDIVVLLAVDDDDGNAVRLAVEKEVRLQLLGDAPGGGEEPTLERCIPLQRVIHLAEEFPLTE